MRASSVILLLGAALLATGLPAGAHEGHGHGPGSVESRHGGDVKSGDRVVVELVQQGKDLLLYPMTRELGPIPLDQVVVEAAARLPRAKKKAPVALEARKSDDPYASHFAGAYDAKDAHRFTLELKLTYQGKKESLSFQVEPRR